jgi:hypothetical protein
MSLLPLKTFAAPGVPLFGAGGGGGGGGGSGGAVSFSTITLPANGQLISVSTISAPASADPTVRIDGDLYVYTSSLTNENWGFEAYLGGGNTMNAFADFDAGEPGQGAVGVRGYSTVGGNQVIDSIFGMTTKTNRQGQIFLQYETPGGGISTIGALSMDITGTYLTGLTSAAGGAGSQIQLSPYTSSILFQPQGAVACHSKIPVSTNSYVPQAGTTQNLGAWTSIAGHLYDVRLPVRLDAVSQPTAGDWAVIGTDTGTANVGLGSFELAQVSTIGNQWETHLCGSVLASGATTTLTAIGKPGAGTSTAVTVTGSLAFIRDLGIPDAQ